MSGSIRLRLRVITTAQIDGCENEMYFGSKHQSKRGNAGQQQLPSQPKGKHILALAKTTPRVAITQG
eukprot:scaffold144574_cov20-Prasinocladus_malaysianus.AAC.1